jgi:hypothetical protein
MRPLEAIVLAQVEACSDQDMEAFIASFGAPEFVEAPRQPTKRCSWSCKRS